MQRFNVFSNALADMTSLNWKSTTENKRLKKTIDHFILASHLMVYLI